MQIPESEVRTMSERSILHIDMDCFYVQVEQQLDTSLLGVPCGVLQYKSFRGGALIAVGYEARKSGVKRGMTKDEASRLCPEMRFARVQETNGKADLTKYRGASQNVFDILCDAPTRTIERLGIDEAFLDVTEEVRIFLQEHNGVPPTHPTSTVLWCGSGNVDASIPYNEMTQAELRLVAASHIADSIRRRITDSLGYTCSAGVALNKVLAKLATGMNKPDGQTVLLPRFIDTLYKVTPIQNIRSLGGKLGETLLSKFGVESVFDLQKRSPEELIRAYGKQKGEWLWYISYGHCREGVKHCGLPKSIGCSKNFPGLTQTKAVHDWIDSLAKEVALRTATDTERNHRRPTTLVFGIYHRGGGSSSKRTTYKDAFPTSSAALLSEAIRLYTEMGSPTPVTALSLAACGFPIIKEKSTKSGGLTSWIKKKGDEDEPSPRKRGRSEVEEEEEEEGESSVACIEHRESREERGGEPTMCDDENEVTEGVAKGGIQQPLNLQRDVPPSDVIDLDSSSSEGVLAEEDHPEGEDTVFEISQKRAEKPAEKRRRRNPPEVIDLC